MGLIPIHDTVAFAVPCGGLASPARGTSGRRAVLLAAALSASAALARRGMAAEPVVTIAGTGSARGTLLELGGALQRQDPLLALRLVPNLGSSGGIAAMLDGVVDMAISGRPVNERERAAGARA